MFLHQPMSAAAAFADPDWRGDQDADGDDRTLRALSSLIAQERRLADWIRGGSCYGWLNAYEARRAAFELQSIQAQRLHGPLADERRLALQSRLDRLDEVLSEARRGAGSNRLGKVGGLGSV